MGMELTRWGPFTAWLLMMIRTVLLLGEIVARHFLLIIDFYG
jgi:hypothetical protein